MSTTTRFRSYGADLIAEERERQVTDEGWQPDHDDGHVQGELVRAAVAYALWTPSEVNSMSNAKAQSYWPFRGAASFSDDPIRNLVKAGALIAAEVDRLRRLQVDQAEAEVKGDDHRPQEGGYVCATCSAAWHEDRCARWCESNDPAHWCFECRSVA